MFTGIITHTALIKRSQQLKDGLTIILEKPREWTDLTLGESVATNGVCLTVSALRANTYSCHLMPETLAKTTFGLRLPRQVNLERSLRAADRFGGHFVQGHIDTIGKVSKVSRSDGYRLTIDYAPGYSSLVIPKGSVSIDGVSLTVTTVATSSLQVALVPFTLEHTTLGQLKAGDYVNIEFDMMGKYIAKMMETTDSHARR